MLTLVVAWLCVRVGVVDVPTWLMLAAMCGDVAGSFFVACACRGWPRVGRGGGGEGKGML